MIPFECPNCRAEFQLQDEFAGKSGKCPKCAQPLKVPALDLPGEPQSVENVTECKPALGGGEEKLWEEIVRQYPRRPVLSVLHLSCRVRAAMVQEEVLGEF